VQMTRVGQNRIYTPYMTVYLVISLPKIQYIHRIYMVLANPTDDHAEGHAGLVHCVGYQRNYRSLTCSLKQNKWLQNIK